MAVSYFSICRYVFASQWLTCRLFRGSFRKFSTGKSPSPWTRHEQTKRSSSLNSIADMSCDNLAPSSRRTRSSSPLSSPVPSLLRCTSQYEDLFHMLAMANLGIHNQCIRLRFQQDLGQHQPGRTYFSISSPCTPSMGAVLTVFAAPMEGYPSSVHPEG